MAEHGCDASNTTAPDWEVLSMSMSAATFGNPTSVAGYGRRAEKPAPKNFFRYPILDDPGIPYPIPAVIDTMKQTKPFHESTSRDGGETIAEPPHSSPTHLHGCGSVQGYGEMYICFPDRSPASSLPKELSSAASQNLEPPRASPTHIRGYGAFHGYGEVDICFPDRSAESSLQRDLSMAASQNLEGEAAESAKEPLLGVSAKNSADQAPKKKARRSWRSKAMWTIVEAATIVGIVILGYRLEAVLHRNQQLQMELSIKDENLNDLTHQVSRLKELLSRHHTVRSSIF